MLWQCEVGVGEVMELEQDGRAFYQPPNLSRILYVFTITFTLFPDGQNQLPEVSTLLALLHPERAHPACLPLGGRLHVSCSESV